MARFDYWLETDLAKPNKVRAAQGVVFSQDAMANRIGVRVRDDGQPASLSGTVQGYVLRADDATVLIQGSLSGSEAWIDLPESAYAVPGPIQVAIRLTSGSEKTVIGACTGYVLRTSTDTIVDPGQVIPSIDDILAKLDEMDAAIAASENVGITQSKSGRTVTITTTDRDGTATTTQLYDGADGSDGSDGNDGATFTPAVSAAGVISWTNDGGKSNPQSVDLVAAVIAALPSATGVTF